MKKISIPALIFMLALGVSALSVVPSVARQTVDAPDFKITDLNGKEHTLAGYRGKVLLLNFWATWCPPCRAEIPDFVDAFKEYNSQGLEILGISVDQEGVGVVKPFVSKFNINYPVAMVTQKIQSDFKPGGYIPTTFIIDKAGRIRDKFVGSIDKEQILAAYKKLIDE